MIIKKVTFKNGKVILTPWLRIEEAAAYCGLSRSAFTDHTRNLPHAGNERTRLYNIKILDDWLNGNLDIPFDPDEKTKIRRRHYQKSVERSIGLVHPITGKIFKPREA
ncbi:MAG: helix-turn-helix domain-containing protein [Deltaproteobacteria bacterium]|nr:helix-turn-helix domain-containing protein [Deltaproteobacteria bacterium]